MSSQTDMIANNEEIQFIQKKVKKVVKKVKTLEEMEAEREELDAQIREAKLIKKLETDMDNYKVRIVKTLERRVESRKRRINDIREQIETLERQIEEIEEEEETYTTKIDELNNLTGDELKEKLTTDYKTEIESFMKETERNVIVPKQKKVVKANDTEDLFKKLDDYDEVESNVSDKVEVEKPKITRARLDRVAHFNALPIGLKLTIKNKHNSTEFVKTENGIERNGKVFNTLNAAGRAFYEEIGNRWRDGQNGWVEFKTMYNGKMIDLATYVVKTGISQL